MKMNKKGEVQQVFIYLMVIIVVGAIFLLGYKLIDDLIGKQCDLGKSTLLTELDKNLEQYSTKGYSKEVDMKVPCDYELLCFVKSKADLDTTGVNINNIPFSGIRQLVSSEDPQNVFLIKDGFAEPIKAADNIQIESSEGFICFKPLSGNFKVSMFGAGKGDVKISASGAAAMASEDIMVRYG